MAKDLFRTIGNKKNTLKNKKGYSKCSPFLIFTIMNLIDGYITEIISEPYEEWGKWWVKVKADFHGYISFSIPMFNTKEEAEKLKVGDKILG